jgi:hypothetical protein
MSIFNEDRHRWRPPLPNGKKRPVVKIRSPYLPFPSGICLACGQKHSPVFVRLENGDSIIVPQSAIPKEELNRVKSKPTNLTDLFWTQEEL